MRALSMTGLTVTTALVLLLSGCSALPKTQDEEAQNRHESEPIDTICVVRHQNPVLRNDSLIRAIEAGLQRAGAKTRVVDPDKVPQQCRLCLFYGVTTEGEKAKTFDFQAVIDGRALQRGSGPVEDDGTLELRTVAGYAADYLQSLANAAKQKRAVEDAVK